MHVHEWWRVRCWLVREKIIVNDSGSSGEQLDTNKEN